LKKFVSLPHVRAALTQDPVEEVDVALARKGLERRFAIIVATQLDVCFVVSNSEMLGIVPERIARPIARLAGVVIHEIPVDLAPWDLSIVWHKRAEKDPGIFWLRDKVCETLSHPTSGRVNPAGAVRSLQRTRVSRSGRSGLEMK
jgi:DNA-binding transcriptional LysR family regulator